MSIKVLIVDDEKLERVLIRNGFDWNKNGFEIIGEAQSGLEALEFVRYRKPDIVLTDISMPQMDGLELSEQIFREMPECHVIIITGYREFEYARRAVKIGVEDFLLKPINIDELEQVTRSMKEKIIQERTFKEQIDQREKNEIANQDILRESFFQRLIKQRIEKADALKKLEIYNCSELCNSCICANIKLEYGTKEDCQGNVYEQVLEFIKKQTYDHVICFVHYMKNIILYFMETNIHDVNKKMQELQTMIHDIYKKLPDIGISSERQGYEGISRAYEDSEKALSVTFYLGQNHCVTYDEYEEVMKKNSGKQDIDWEDFLFCVNNGMSDKTVSYITEYAELIRISNIPDKEYLRLMTMNLLLKAGATLNRYATDLEQLLGENQLYPQVRKIHSVDEMKEYLMMSVGVILLFHESKKVKQGNKVVMEALEYVNHNLCIPELTLRLVASKVYANESYLSRAFKKEVGQSLIEYITKKRIEESIRLMNTTDLKVYEIAEQVGFRDPHYFSICFKKQTGMTVKEFRR